VFDEQGNITDVGPWYRRDRHEHYAKASRLKDPSRNLPILWPPPTFYSPPERADNLTRKRRWSVSSLIGAASPPEEDSALRQLHADIYQFLSDLYRMW
jgi:hypothetical protein